MTTEQRRQLYQCNQALLVSTPIFSLRPHLCSLTTNQSFNPFQQYFADLDEHERLTKIHVNTLADYRRFIRRCGADSESASECESHLR